MKPGQSYPCPDARFSPIATPKSRTISPRPRAPNTAARLPFILPKYSYPRIATGAGVGFFAFSPKPPLIPPPKPIKRAPPDPRGEVPEWSNGAVSKTVVGATPPRVRIPVSPPLFHRYYFSAGSGGPRAISPLKRPADLLLARGDTCAIAVRCLA